MKDFFNSLFSTGGLFILTIVAARLTFMQQIGLQLTPDEAYYWDWSRHLAWGYYSKPPLVAWLIALSTAKLGISEYAVRIPAVLLGGLYLVFIYYLARRLFDAQMAIWAVLAAAVSLISAVYSFVMTIDPPLLAFWAIALCLGWLAAENQSLKGFLFTGVAVGLGLLAKQTMIAFPVLYFVWLAWDRTKQGLLRTPGPYLMALVALVMILPNLIWNAKHDWIMFRHTSTHFQEQAFHLTGPLRFLTEQAGVITPIIFALMLLVFFIVATRPKLREQSPLLYLFVFSAVPLLLVLPLSFLRKVNANWPAPFYTSAFILVTALCLRAKWPGGRERLIRRLFLLGVLLGMVVNIVAYRLPVMPQKFPPKIAAILYKFYGWKEMASKVEALRPKGALIITNRRDFASELAFYLPDHPQTYTFWGGRVSSQYDLWDGLSRHLGQDAVIVKRGWPSAKALAACFEEVKPLASWEEKLIGGRVRGVEVLWGRGLRPCSLIGPQRDQPKSP